jgi:hypothetical protein
MAILVKHNKVSSVPDTADTSLVRPSDWNADHTLTGFGTAAEKDAGVPNGVATLDSGGKVPVSELPAAVLGALSYQGTWNASTNTPTLTSSTGTKGYYYVVSVAGNTNLDGITDWLVGDWAVYNGTVWQKVDNTETVTSVNGQTGAVTLTTTNIAEGTNEYFTTARARASVSAGTAISYDNGTGVITNAAPDQVVSLTGAGTTSISGTYPNFTITSNDSKVGDVVGPSSATNNAIARYDSTTGKLIQNSLVIVDDTGSVTGVNALTAQSLTVNNNATLGSSNTDSIDVRGRISSDLEPETNNAKDIGTNGRNWRDGFFGRTLHTVNLELTGTTSFDGSQGTSGQVLTSAGTGATPTWTTPTTGTVTSVDLTASTGISVSGGPITSSGSITVTNTAPDQTVVLTAGTGISTSGTYPSFTVTNTAPDQTVAISSGTGISVSGTYPNFTVTNTSPSSGGTVTSVGGTGTVNGISLSGTVTSSGNLTLGGTLSGVDLTTQVTGTLPVANGGTGLTSLTANRVPYGNGTSALGNEADFTYDPSLNTVTAPQVAASNGIFVNSATVTASYSIPSGSNAMSAGVITIANGITVTIPNGNNWIIV